MYADMADEVPKAPFPSRTTTDEQLPLRGTEHDPDPTPPLGMKLGDRVILENRINVLEAEFRIALDQRNAEADRFQFSRMVPLEKTVSQLHGRLWFSIGVSVSTLIACVGILVAMIMLHLGR